MTSIAKAEIAPAIPTELRHHRELPEGSYHVILSGFRESLHVVKRLHDGVLYLVDWRGKGRMLNQFDVLPGGAIEFDDPNDRSNP